MNFKIIMMMTVAAAIVAAPAFADSTKMKHHSKHAKTVSSTMVVSDTTMGSASGAQNVERMPEGTNNKSDEQKVQGVGANPNSHDPSSSPR